MPPSLPPPPKSPLSDRPLSLPPGPRKGSKRKLPSSSSADQPASKDDLLQQLRSEIDSLIRFYHEDGDLQLEVPLLVGLRSEVALLIEGSCLPFSKLVAEVYGKLSASGNASTLSSVKSSVLSIGQRIAFGIPNPDADVLEDDSDACLWCWEVRDIKIIPEAQRGFVAARQFKRKKIGERISALSASISMLTVENDEERSVLAAVKKLLTKTDGEASLRSSIVQWQQKLSAKCAAKDAKLKDKEALKEQQRLAREAEKEQKRLMKEEEKKRLQQEKERDRQEKEASKRSLKEAIRQEKETKRQLEDAEKESKRKEKEAADLKKQAALQKQARLMDSFLHSVKKEHPDTVPSVSHDSSLENHACDTSSDNDKLIRDMDHEMMCTLKTPEELFGSHCQSWRMYLQNQRKFRRWGERRLPKRPPVPELRLQGVSFNGYLDDARAVPAVAESPRLKRTRKEFEGGEVDHELCESGLSDFPDVLDEEVQASQQKVSNFLNKRRKLLQFDKSHRPAFYGSFSKRSEAIKPRNPLKMDPSLDYENDSDEEWEEEDPGESLSDCDKDDDDEKGDIDEDDETADGFVVPDGYLSENEGAHVDDSDCGSDRECENDPAANLRQAEPEQAIFKFARQRKALQHLTDQALRCNRPHIITNFHMKQLSELSTMDRLCLEALKMCPLNEVSVEMPCNPELEKKEIDETKPGKQKVKMVLPESALREMVEVMMTSSYGLKRLVDMFSVKFPSATRSHLRSKIKEIADFVDNHWQIKKEVAEQLGVTLSRVEVISSPPEHSAVKSSPMQLKPITKFFSKRCLPPEKAGLEEQSPQKKKGVFMNRNPEFVTVNGTCESGTCNF